MAPTQALLTTLLALATPTDDADAARAKAKEHFATAERHYAAKELREAITEYKKAHDLLPMPAFIFNIAQCHRGLGEHAQAIENYERYLQEAGNPDDRELVEQLIAEEKTAVALAATETATLAAVPAPALVTTRASVLDPEPEPTAEVYEEWWFWTAVAVAATAIAGGTAIAVATSGERDPTELPRGSAGTLDWRSP
jgi:tetratricopeptide (TPR) repeat protein